MLLALALALTVGVTYAAYRVYNDIWLPAQQAQQEVPALVESDDAEKVPAATGQPAHLFQLAEILALDPADIPAYFESEGLAYRESAGLEYGGESLWVASGENVAAFEAADSDGTLFDYDALASGSQMVVKVGTEVTSAAHGSPETQRSAFGAAALTQGSVPDSIAYTNVPIAAMSSREEVYAFAEACRLGLSRAMVALDDDPMGQTVAVGFADRNGERMMWYLDLRGFGGASSQATQSGGASMGCCSIETARQIVVRDVGLFADAEWDAASDGERAVMLAKCLVQDAHSGNGALRTNYETGGFEVMGLSADGATYAWEACSIVDDPATGEPHIIADASGVDWGPVSGWGISADDPIPTWRFIDSEEA